jgi:PadR family transcriptional regulator, regulatory protein PadR
MRHVVADPIGDRHKALTEPVFLILTSLAGKPQHGYSLLKDIEGLSEGRLRLSTGTLYGALSRLLADGWIERFAQKDTSRDKQAYRLTPLGRKGLQQELERMARLTRAAHSRMKTAEAKI